jgi:hypothetical protein
VHSLDTALSAVRAWAEPGGAGSLYVLHQRDLYRLDARVERDEDGLRVDARIVSMDEEGAPTPLTLWLAGDGWQTPARVEVDHPRGRVVAEHIEL